MTKGGGGGIVPSSYIHKALQLMGTGKLEKARVKCLAGFTILRLLQDYFFNSLDSRQRE